MSTKHSTRIPSRAFFTWELNYELLLQPERKSKQTPPDVDINGCHTQKAVLIE